MNRVNETPEVLGYTKYYEMDGRLRAYSKRTMLLATLFALLAVVSIGFAVFVRFQPATVVRVDSSGNAVVLGGPHQMLGRTTPDMLLASTGQGDASTPGPSEVERVTIVRLFLERYLAYTPDSVAQNIAQALNMMSPNFSKYILDKLTEAGTVRLVKEGNITSEFRINRMDLVNDTRWTYVVVGFKELHHWAKGVERIDRIVGHYRVRLEEVPRSYQYPNGLAVAEFSESQAWGNEETGLLQQGTIDKQR
jgi:hypothetical protein